jgi:hypothetical protein
MVISCGTTLCRLLQPNTYDINEENLVVCAENVGWGVSIEAPVYITLTTRCHVTEDSTHNHYNQQLTALQKLYALKNQICTCQSCSKIIPAAGIVGAGIAQSV